MRLLVAALALPIITACGDAAIQATAENTNSTSTERPDQSASTVNTKANMDNAGFNPNADLGSLTNWNPLYRVYERSNAASLKQLGVNNERFTEPAGRPDNGPQPGQGQFRIACQWSHFAYDDPITKARQAGAAHLHMFWGNTGTNAFTRYNRKRPAGRRDILERGGSTCQGFELNRSAYWMPAIVGGTGAQKTVALPSNIIMYYKTYRPTEVNVIPPGLKLLAGNVSPGGMPRASFAQTNRLFWSCGSNGAMYNEQDRIPTNCRAGDPINATIKFPQCLRVDRQGRPRLSSRNFVSHALLIDNSSACPASHPYRIPQISFKMYWPNGSDGRGAGVSTWRLSSDTGEPGGSLHGDFMAGWQKDLIQLWVENCYDPGQRFNGPRNCSNGQTGTSRILRRVSPLNNYTGPY
ncbi:MAG: DUF1996 domain-containing protein, partial [Burkholderiaceae bacterium]